DIRFLFFRMKYIQNMRFEYHTNINDVSDEIINNSAKGNYVQRGKEELDWILKYPWLIEGATADCNSITIPYVYSDKTALDKVAKFLIYKMIELKINMITTFDDDLADALKKNRKYFLFTKQIKKPYLISKKVDIQSLSFQDGDGDCVFY
ncbi:MAG: hypothetical protein ACOCWB_07855, partial [Bacteroidota bacterium]